MRPKVIVILVIAVLALIVLLQNTGEVELQFLFWNPPMPQIVLILLCLGLGFVAGFITAKLAGRQASPPKNP